MSLDWIADNIHTALHGSWFHFVVQVMFVICENTFMQILLFIFREKLNFIPSIGNDFPRHYEIFFFCVLYMPYKNCVVSDCKKPMSLKKHFLLFGFLWKRCYTSVPWRRTWTFAYLTRWWLLEPKKFSSGKEDSLFICSLNLFE